MQKLEKIPGKPDHRLLKLDKTVFGAAMKFLDLEETRKKLDFARGNVASKNVQMIEQLVQKRQELALLLGFTSFSQMILENRMAKNVQTVENFEDDLTNRIHGQGVEEMNKLV